MRIGILGPIDTDVVAPLLDDAEGLPPGTGAPSVSLLVTALVRAGHEVRVWTTDWRTGPRQVAEGAGLRIWYGSQPVRGRGRTFHRHERLALRAALEDATVGDAGVDVLNAHWTYEFAWEGLRRPHPLVVTARDWPPAILRHQTSPYRVIRTVEAARVVAARPPMTAPSPYLARRYRALGLDVAVIPNGIDPAAVTGPRRRGPGMRVLAVANGWDRRKNTTTLLRAVAGLRRRGVGVELELLGTGHGPGEEAAAWAAAEGLADGVAFTGRVAVDGVLAAMDRADLLVHPAREESYGRVLAEAMGRGLPVVGGRRSGAVPWVLDDGRTGVLVDVDDADAIARAVEDLLGDPARWEALSAAGARAVAERFGMDAIAAAYVRAYEAVVAGRRLRDRPAARR